ncbi:MAG: hypothetical protein ACP5KN_07270 [Armatimonadota bacterium]
MRRPSRPPTLVLVAVVAVGALTAGPTVCGELDRPPQTKVCQCCTEHATTGGDRCGCLRQQTDREPATQPVVETQRPPLAMLYAAVVAQTAPAPTMTIEAAPAARRTEVLLRCCTAVRAPPAQP